jgi:hypothetical protein
MTAKTTATFAPAPEASGTPFGATSLDLASKGHVEEEYSASGTANRYRMNFTSTDGAGGTAGQPDDPLATAEVVDAGHPYTTRILVRRPTDADSFSGIVIVEWFNVSLGQDVDFRVCRHSRLCALQRIRLGWRQRAVGWDERPETG